MLFLVPNRMQVAVTCFNTVNSVPKQNTMRAQSLVGFNSLEIITQTLGFLKIEAKWGTTEQK
jgi:hypothetical protein